MKEAIDVESSDSAAIEKSQQGMRTSRKKDEQQQPNLNERDDVEELRLLLRKVRSGRPANWTTRYRVGVVLNRQMEPQCTLEQLATELGITKQNAYTETVLALGSLACRLHVDLGLDLR